MGGPQPPGGLPQNTQQCDCANREAPTAERAAGISNTASRQAMLLVSCTAAPALRVSLRRTGRRSCRTNGNDRCHRLVPTALLPGKLASTKNEQDATVVIVPLSYAQVWQRRRRGADQGADSGRDRDSKPSWEATMRCPAQHCVLTAGLALPGAPAMPAGTWRLLLCYVKAPHRLPSAWAGFHATGVASHPPPFNVCCCCCCCFCCCCSCWGCGGESA